jgi:hypothetical protein
VPDDRRTEQAIRGEIAVEREQLASALADLREGIESKRRPAAIIGGALAAGLAALATVKVIRGLTGE